jgi:hypothetical protein
MRMQGLGGNMQITLQYDGAMSDSHLIEFYDAARGLVGFQRTLALVTHLVLHGDIITQAPSLRGASILTPATVSPVSGYVTE